MVGRSSALVLSFLGARGRAASQGIPMNPTPPPPPMQEAERRSRGVAGFDDSDVVCLESRESLTEEVFGGGSLWIIGFYLPQRCPHCFEVGEEMKAAAAELRGSGVRIGAINALAPGLEQLPSDFSAWPLILPKKGRTDEPVGIIKFVTINMDQKLAGRAGIIGGPGALYEGTSNLAVDSTPWEECSSAKLLALAQAMLAARSTGDIALLKTWGEAAEATKAGAASAQEGGWSEGFLGVGGLPGWSEGFLGAIREARSRGVMALDTKSAAEIWALFRDEPLTQKLHLLPVGGFLGVYAVVSLYLYLSIWLQQVRRAPPHPRPSPLSRVGTHGLWISRGRPASVSAEEAERIRQQGRGSHGSLQGEAAGQARYPAGIA
jgi:hypothetical protein